MAAGSAAMGKVYPPQRAAEFFEWSEQFRTGLNDMFSAKAVPLHCNGLGSMFALLFSHGPLQRRVERSAACQSLMTLLHLELLLDGVLICNRGDLFLSLPLTASHLSQARLGLEGFVDRYKPLMSQVLPPN